jgi:CDP-diacylglycerol--serine O-phosphatidyltransferase
MRLPVPRARRPRTPRRSRREQLRRGIFVLPSLFTVGNMLCGFAAILDAMYGKLEPAGWLILLAGLLDGLDGRIARLTNATSEFGKEYDSLADVVSFGVAPAVLAYQWGLHRLGRWGWMAAFLFVVAGSVRLARFNVKAHEGDRRYFSGLPIPGGAGALTLMVLIDPSPVMDRRLSVVIWLFVLLVSTLMVSAVPYRSFKDLNLRRRWPATAFFLIALIVASVVVLRLIALAFFLGVYLLAGPTELLIRRLARRSTAPVAAPPSEVVRAPTHSDHP